MHAIIAYMRHPGVYQIRNRITGKLYIGSSVNVTNRLAVHLFHLIRGSHHSRYLQRAFNRWGYENFCFETIEDLTNPPTETAALKLTLLSREQFHLDRVQAHDPRFGYNVIPTAGSQLGAKRTKEFCDTMSAARKGQPRNPPITDEIRAKFLQGGLATRFGPNRVRKPSTEEITNWQRAGRKAKAQLREMCNLVRFAQLLAPRDVAVIRQADRDAVKANKIATTLRGRPHTAERRANQSAAHKDVPLSETHRRAIGAGGMGKRWQGAQTAEIASMYFDEGLNFTDIAKRIGISRVAVSVRLRVAGYPIWPNRLTGKPCDIAA
jgi:group I intron endonuclease